MLTLLFGALGYPRHIWQVIDAKVWLTVPRQRYAKYLCTRNLNEDASLLIYFDLMILIHIGPPALLLFCFSKILNLLFVDLYLFLNSLSWKICHPTHLQLECPKWAIWSSIHQLLNIIYLYRYFCVCLKMLIGVFVSTWTLYACERAPN
jgi:hypothetical protein